MRTSRPAFAILVLVAVACAPGPTPSATDSSVPAATSRVPETTIDVQEREAEVSSSIEFRRQALMRADEAWVRALLTDPTAVRRMGTLMSPAEAAQFDSRISVQEAVVPALVEYGGTHPDDWAGLVLVPETGEVVVLVTDRLDEHRAAIGAMFVPGLRFRVAQVRYTAAELERFRRRVINPEAFRWIESLGVRVEGGGSRPAAGQVEIMLTAPEPMPDLEQRIIDHFDAEGWLDVTVRIGPGAFLPYGSVTVEVLDRDGRPVTEWTVCMLVRPRAAGAESWDVNAVSGVCRWPAVRATTFDLEIRRDSDEPAIASATVVVQAGKETALTIRLAE